MQEFTITNAHRLPEAPPALPRPDRKIAMLVSAGIKKPTYTVHFYVESRRCPEEDAIEFVYQCSETNVRRRFGLIPLSVRSREPGNY